MTWLNPWAFAGLLAIAVPILVHLLTRRRTRVRRFPTLRFVPASRLVPVRTLRPSDLALLALRCAIVAVAAIALAQPQIRTGARRQEAADVLARVVVVDTSASMLGAIAAAREAAMRAASEAPVATTIETAVPAAELRGAGEWLRHQPGRREVVVVSDFQAGTLDDHAIADVPADVGIVLVRVTANSPARERVHRRGDLETRVQAVFDDTATTATWSITAAADTVAPFIAALVGDDEHAAADAMLAAAWPFITPPADTARSVAVVFPGHQRRAELERTARPPNEAWMGDVAAATGARVALDGSNRLLVFTDAQPGTLDGVSLIIAAANALSRPASPSEQEPASIDDARLDAWRRAPASVVIPTGDDGASDGRWLWLLVIALLGLEMAVRRQRTIERMPAAAEEYTHERVA